MGSLRRNVGAVTVTIALAVTIVAVLESTAEARCWPIWLDGKTYWECDEEGETPKPEIYICDFVQDRDRAGRWRTKTVFCRPDGSIWKVVVVRAHKVVARKLRRDGSLAWRREFPLRPDGRAPNYRGRPRTDSDHYGPPARMRPPASEKPRRKKKPRAAAPPKPAPKWMSKRFETRIIGHKVTGMVFKRGNEVKGHINIYGLFGGKAKYHYQGKIEGNQVRAWHGDGHKFRGTISRDGRIVGTVTTNKGLSIPVNVPNPWP